MGQRYVSACIQGPWETQRLRLVEETQQVLGARADSQPLSLRHASLLQLTEAIFYFLEYSCDLSVHIYAALQGLQIGFTHALVSDPAALARPEQPHRQFLELLVVAFKGYDQYSGKRAHTLLGEAGRKVAEAIVSPVPDGEACQSAKRAFAGLLQRYNRESLIYDKSLIVKEQGQTARDDARLIVNREILAAVRGHRLPAQLLRFFQEVWSNYLYVTYLREGLTSDAWKEGIAVIAPLVHSLSIRDPHEMFRFYQEKLAQALALVRRGAESIHQDTLLTHTVLEYLDTLFLQVIQGDEPDLPILEDAPTYSLGDTEADLSPADHQALDGLRLGDWYLIRAGGLETRGKLIQKDAALGYCLFSNYSGLKAARLKIAGLAATLADGVLRRLDTAPVAERALEWALSQLEGQLQRMEVKVRAVEQGRERLAREHARETAKVEEAAHLKRLHEQAQQEAAAIREQERRAAEEQVRDAKQQRELAWQQGQERALEGALIEAQRLQPGGWLELLTADDGKHACKLGLKLKSSQKMIFVDRLGQKVAEMFPADLAARIVEGSARIIDYGVAFDDTLQSLILDRSEKIHVE